MKGKGSHFNPIKKSKRIFEEVALNIKESILEGVWEPGDRLPSENELASQFGVSRHTIREALRTLELTGFVEIKTGVSGGPIVKDGIISTIGDLYIDAFQMEKITAEEFTKARSVIEKGLLAEAVEKADPNDIKELKECIDAANSLLEKNRIEEMDHFKFHSLLAKASKNKVFIILEKGINSIHNEMRKRSQEGTPEDYKATKKAYKEHQMILDAIIDKDADKAIKILEKHLKDVSKTFNHKK